jgi:hypothetical protein
VLVKIGVGFDFVDLDPERIVSQRHQDCSGREALSEYSFLLV